MEIEDVEVFLHAFLVCALGNGDDAALRQPAQSHLCHRFVVVLRQFAQHFVVEELSVALRERRPRHDARVELVEQPLHLTLLRQHVGFQLIHGRKNLVVHGQVGEASAAEIAHAHSTHLPHHQGRFHCAPRTVIVAEGLVHQQEVDVVGAESFQTLVDRSGRFALAGVADPHFGGEKQVLARHAAAANAFAHATFVAIGLRRVDEPVAHFNGIGHTAGRLLIVDLKHAVAQRRHGETIVEFDVLHIRDVFRCRNEERGTN